MKNLSGNSPYLSELLDSRTEIFVTPMNDNKIHIIKTQRNVKYSYIKDTHVTNIHLRLIILHGDVLIENVRVVLFSKTMKLLLMLITTMF